MGYWLVLLSTLLFAASNLFFLKGLNTNKISVDKYVGLFISILINNVTNIGIVGVIFIVGTAPIPNLSGIFFSAMGGLFTSFLGRYVLFSCIEKIGASMAGTLKITAPLFAVLIGVFFLKEQITLQAYFGITSILIGVYLISCGSSKVIDNQCEEKAERLFQKDVLLKGVILGILSGLLFGVGNVFRKLGVTYYPYPILSVSIGSFTALIAVSFLLALQKKVPRLSSFFSSGLKSGYVSGGICTSLALYSLFYALRIMPVSLANSMQATEPLFIIVLAFLFFKNSEVITRKVILCSAIIIFGTILIIAS